MFSKCINSDAFSWTTQEIIEDFEQIYFEHIDILIVYVDIREDFKATAYWF